MENRFLFRGKRIDNGEWVEGYYVKGLDMHDKEVHMIFEPGTIFYSSGETDGWVEVEASTICQCTGIKDKNGNLIFENNIMGAHIDDDFPEDVSRFKVEWNGRGWVENQPGAVDREYLDDFDTEHYAVIGNVFDDPELLEV